MAKVYTRKVFYKFQEELQYSMVCCSSHKKLDGEDVEQYDVTCCRNSKGLISHVIYKGANRRCTCSCQLLESEGLPCRHLLYVLRLNEGDIFPEMYIMKRWTIDIAKEVVFDGEGVELHGDCQKTLFSNWGELHCIFNRWAKKAYSSSEKFELAKQKLLEIEKLVEDVVDDRHHGIQLHHGIQVHPPAQSKTKGSGKRWKSGKELALDHLGKDRLCHGCNQRGVGHDKRTCPAIVSR